LILVYVISANYLFTFEYNLMLYNEHGVIKEKGVDINYVI